MSREDRVPAFCPVCERLMTGKESVKTWYNFGSCSDCFIQWIEDREERWHGGWRPSPEQVQAFVTSLKSRAF